MTGQTHTFTLVFTVPGESSLEEHLDALFAAGCDDAAFIGPAGDGTVLAEFDREATAFSDAVVSALEAIRSAIPTAMLKRVEPDDLVTISAIASRTWRSDESIRLLWQGRRGPGTFPAPAGRINDKTQVWRWSEVARWFSDEWGEVPDAAEHANFLAALNDALDLGARADELRPRVSEWEAVQRFLPEDLTAA